MGYFEKCVAKNFSAITIGVVIALRSSKHI